MADQETIAVYDKQVEEYAKLVAAGPDLSLKAFVEKLPENALVLDLGCGPANASAWMRSQGFQVDPTDASAEMVRLANEVHDISARQATFEDVIEKDHYDGVWANFSLLHATREDFPEYLAKIHDALKADCPFHIGMKLGEAEERDKIGRFYTYYSEEELRGYLEAAGFIAVSAQHGEEYGLAGNLDAWITILSLKTGV